MWVHKISRARFRSERERERERERESEKSFLIFREGGMAVCAYGRRLCAVRKLEFGVFCRKFPSLAVWPPVPLSIPVSVHTYVLHVWVFVLLHRARSAPVPNLEFFAPQLILRVISSYAPLTTNEVSELWIISSFDVDGSCIIYCLLDFLYNVYFWYFQNRNA